MPQIGETVLYGTSGVCRVDGTTKNEYGEYFVLVPLYKRETKVFVPRDNEQLLSRIRPLPAKRAVDKIMRNVFKTKGTWNQNESARRDAAKEALREGDEAQIMELMKTFYEQKEKTLRAGKKFHVADDVILQEAQGRIFDEFAVIYDIEPQEVEKLIMKRHAAATA